jgi:hypothetical protein
MLIGEGVVVPSCSVSTRPPAMSVVRRKRADQAMLYTFTDSGSHRTPAGSRTRASNAASSVM